MKKLFSVWLILAITISCIVGIVYITIQQDIRIGANDPQIQIAEDTVVALNTNDHTNLPQHIVDISRSLSPFIMIFNANGTTTSSEAVLHGQTPVIPPGIFAYVTTHEDRFTWQPETGVRIAAVVAKYQNGYVLVGRNIREVEKREDNLTMQILFGWIATLIISFLATKILYK